MIQHRSTKPMSPPGHARDNPIPTSSAVPPIAGRRKALFAVVLLLGAIALGEGFCRLFLHGRPDAVWRLEQAQFSKTGFPSLASVLEFDPDLFWRLRPSLAGYELVAEKYYPPAKFSISTDALSCRLMPARLGAGRHVVFLGDSSTVGLGVDDDQTYASLIQARSADMQCRNLGCVGYTAYQGRRRLETFPFEQPPDVVVMAFGVNDNLPWDNLGDAAHDRLLHCGTEGLGRVSALVGAVERAVLTMRLRSAAPRKRLTDAEFAEQLGGMIQWCRSRRAEPILLLWPYEPQLRTALYNSKQTAMTQVAQRERVRLIDLVPVFKGHSREALFFTEVHLSAAGHSLVADTLLPHLGGSASP